MYVTVYIALGKDYMEEHDFARCHCQSKRCMRQKVADYYVVKVMDYRDVL